MGVGTPWNILEAIDLGVDMFDCVMPTQKWAQWHDFYFAGGDQYQKQKMV